MNENERKRIIALKYNETKHAAPIVTAKGEGLIADQLLQEARKNNIPIYEDASLIEVLKKVQIEDAIPEELFRAVAEVFAFIYQVDQRAKKNG